MKTSQWFSLFCIAWLALFASPLRASDLPEAFPYLANRSALITEMSRFVSGGTAYFSSEGMIFSTNIMPYADVSGDAARPEAILAELANSLLTMQTAHPESDWVSSAIVLRDNNGHVLFYGSTSFKLVKDRFGDWAVPSSGSMIQMRLASGPRIYVGRDVYAARVAVRSKSDGHIIDYRELEVDDGWLTFPADLAGIGDLVLYTSGGQVVYDLRNQGQRIRTDVISGTVSGSLDDLVTRVDENVGSFVMKPQSQDGYGAAKAVAVSVTSNRTIHFSGLTSENEPAVYAVSVNVDTGERKTYEIPVGGSAGVYFTPGEYKVYLIWRDGFDTFPTEWWYGG